MKLSSQAKHTCKAVFGQVPFGISFEVPGDLRTWYVGSNQTAFTFAEDRNTKLYADFTFSQPVRVVPS